MRAAFGRVDVVDVRVDVFGVLGRVLHGDFDGDAFVLAFDVDDVGVDRLAGAVEVLDELRRCRVVLERLVFAGALVGERDPHARLRNASSCMRRVERVVDELGVREDLRIGLERGLGAALVGVCRCGGLRSLGTPRSYSCW